MKIYPMKMALAACVLLAGCSDEPESEAPAALTGSWRAVLSSPGGELPFELVFDDDQSAWIRNGEERAPLSHVRRSGADLVLAFDWYDAEISATVSADGSVMRGRWRKTTADEDSQLEFAATRGMAVRFLPAAQQSAAPFNNLDGSWKVLFTDEDGNEPARGEFRQRGQKVSGTFLTPTGDYRYLDGSFAGGLLRLSTFDGAHAFLFTAQAQADGTLVGDFWSRDTYHATWVGTRLQSDEAVLPDAWTQVRLSRSDATIEFAFDDLEGQQVSLADPRFANKVVLVNLFGSWCPNCNDEAPLLSQWYREYQDEGLEIIGLAFEYTGDVARDREMVRRFAQRHSIDYPLLIAGVSDKQEAASAIGFLDRVVAYPTTLFLDRNHVVRKIHSGFAGPGTGDHHTALVAELQAELERLLAEPQVSGGP